jgi:hypothetical protein
MFLSWITQLVKRAVLKGFQEAAEELDLQDGNDTPEALESLKGRMNALPAPSSNGEGKKIAKAR